MNKVRVKLIRNWTEIGQKFTKNDQNMSEIRWDKRWQENGLS